jgi:hypothetical protein
MGFRFRRSLTIVPGIRLNLGRRGISTTVGRRGASVTFGRRGAHANLGLPGTGLSYRQRLDLPGDRSAARPPGATGPLLLVVLAALALWALLALLV